MVLEQLFKLKWIEKKEHSFFLGFIYSIVGIISAKLVHPTNTGIMSIAYTSLLLVPSLSLLLKEEENVEIREKKFHIWQLLKDHKDIFKIYLSLFLGIFFAYFLISFIFQDFTIEKMFFTQLKAAGILGYAFSSSSILAKIVLNNLLVFTVAFILSLVYGAGAILFLSWNASVWGVAFAIFAKSNFENFTTSIPHMVTEGFAYVTAAIAGGVVSKAAIREKVFSKKFNHILTDALILVFIGVVLVLIAGYIEVRIIA